MKKEDNIIPKNSDQQNGFFIDEEIFGKFSKNIFKVPIFGYLCGICINIVYLYCWAKKKNIFSIAILLFIDYLIIEIILRNIFKIKKES